MRHVDEQVVGRALEALPPDEAVQVDRHVATCPACHRLLHDVQETAHLLTLVVPPAQPPYHCKARVMERIVREGARQRSVR